MNAWARDMVKAVLRRDLDTVGRDLDLGFPLGTSLKDWDQERQRTVWTTCLHLLVMHRLISVIWKLTGVKEAWEAMDSLHRTPLIVACERGDLEIVRILVENVGVNLACKDSEGNSLLHIAGTRGELGLLKYFVEKQGMSVTLRNKQKLNALEHCKTMKLSSEGMDDIIFYLANCRNHGKETTKETVSRGMETYNSHNNCVALYRYSQQWDWKTPAGIKQTYYTKKGLGKPIDFLLKTKCNLVYENMLGIGRNQHLKNLTMREPHRYSVS